LPVHAENGIKVRLTAHAVFASLAKYSTEICEQDSFEEALVVAASLYYNRYLDNASLPTVNSTCELLLPGFVMRNTAVQPRPHVSLATLKSVGKLHQMQILLVVKDVIMSAKMSTNGGADYRRSAVDAFATYEMIMLTEMKNVTAMRLLERTSKLRWTNKMTKDYISDMDEMSIFECLWLAEHGEACMREGGIKVLKDARKDGNDFNPYTQVMMEEIVKGEIDYDVGRLPDGDFTVATRFVRSNKCQEIERKTFTKLVRTEVVKQTKISRKERLYGKKPQVVKRPLVERKSFVRDGRLEKVRLEPEVEAGEEIIRVTTPEKTARVFSSPEPVRRVATPVARKATPEAPVVEKRPLSPFKGAIHRSSNSLVGGIHSIFDAKSMDKWAPKKREAVLPPADVMADQMKAEKYGLRANKEADANISHMDERVASANASEQKARSTMEKAVAESARVAPSTDTERMLADRNIPFRGEVMRMTLAELIDKVRPVLVHDLTVQDVQNMSEKLLGVSIDMRMIQNWDALLEELNVKGALRSSRKKLDSGTNYTYNEADSVILNATILHLRKSRGTEWITQQSTIAMMMDEFQLSELELKIIRDSK
jgi:hypothetical protein